MDRSKDNKNGKPFNTNTTAPLNLYPGNANGSEQDYKFWEDADEDPYVQIELQRVRERNRAVEELNKMIENPIKPHELNSEQLGDYRPDPNAPKYPPIFSDFVQKRRACTMEAIANSIAKADAESRQKAKHDAQLKGGNKVKSDAAKASKIAPPQLRPSRTMIIAPGAILPEQGPSRSMLSAPKSIAPQHGSPRPLFTAPELSQHGPSRPMFTASELPQHGPSRPMFTAPELPQHGPSRPMFTALELPQHGPSRPMFTAPELPQHGHSRSMLTAPASQHGFQSLFTAPGAPASQHGQSRSMLTAPAPQQGFSPMFTAPEGPASQHGQSRSMVTAPEASASQHGQSRSMITASKAPASQYDQSRSMFTAPEAPSSQYGQCRSMFTALEHGPSRSILTAPAPQHGSRTAPEAPASHYGQSRSKFTAPQLGPSRSPLSAPAVQHGPPQSMNAPEHVPSRSVVNTPAATGILGSNSVRSQANQDKLRVRTPIPQTPKSDFVGTPTPKDSGGWLDIILPNPPLGIDFADGDPTLHSYKNFPKNKNWKLYNICEQFRSSDNEDFENQNRGDLGAIGDTRSTGTTGASRRNGVTEATRTTGATGPSRTTGDSAALRTIGATEAIRTTRATEPLRTTGATEAIRTTNATEPSRTTGAAWGSDTTGGTWDSDEIRAIWGPGAVNSTWGTAPIWRPGVTDDTSATWGLGVVNGTWGTDPIWGPRATDAISTIWGPRATGATNAKLSTDPSNAPRDSGATGDNGANLHENVENSEDPKPKSQEEIDYGTPSHNLGTVWEGINAELMEMIRRNEHIPAEYIQNVQNYQDAIYTLRHIGL